MNKFLMILMMFATTSVMADYTGYLYWMVDTSSNPYVGEFSYAKVRAEDSSSYLCFVNTSGQDIGTDMTINGYGPEKTSGTVAGPLYTGMTSGYAGTDNFIFEMWLEDAGGEDSLVGHAVYAYSQLTKNIYSNMSAGSGNSPLSVYAVPEPSGALLMLFGFAALALRRRKVRV